MTFLNDYNLYVKVKRKVINGNFEVEGDFFNYIFLNF